jgi:tetratricopeptide (TPR) repeat protein
MLYQCFRVTILSRLERYEEVVTAAKESLEVDPKHWHSYDQMFEALFELGRQDEAKREVEELLARYPQKAEALAAAGWYFYAEGSHERSVQLFTGALAIDDKCTRANYGRGLTYFKMRNFPAAVEDLKRVVSKNVDRVGAHCRLSDAFLQVKDFEAAVKTAKRLLTLDPKHFHAYVVIGSGLLQLGRTEEATKAFETLLAFTDVHALAGAARAAQRNKLATLSQKLVNRALELDATNSDVLEAALSLQIDAGDFVAAWATASKLGTQGRFAQVAQAQAGQGLLLAAFASLFEALKGSTSKDRSPSLVRMVSRVISAAIRRSGPSQIPEAFRWLRGQGHETTSTGLLGGILTNLLSDVALLFRGRREDWESAVVSLRELLEDLSECQIPLAMFGAAVGFTFSGEQRYLLELPLEQRQLLEGVLSKRKQMLH